MTEIRPLAPSDRPDRNGFIGYGTQSGDGAEKLDTLLGWLMDPAHPAPVS